MNQGSALTARMRVRLRDSEIEMPMFSQISENIWQAGCPQNGIPLPGRFAHVVNLAGVLSYRETHVLTTSTVVDMADCADQSMDIVEPLARLVADLAERFSAGEARVTHERALVRHCPRRVPRGPGDAAAELEHAGPALERGLDALLRGALLSATGERLQLAEQEQLLTGSDDSH